MRKLSHFKIIYKAYFFVKSLNCVILFLARRGEFVVGIHILDKWRINMILFCPVCANILLVEEAHASHLRYACNTCPYVYNIGKKISSKTYPKLKVFLVSQKIINSIPCLYCELRRVGKRRWLFYDFWDFQWIHLIQDVNNRLIMSLNNPFSWHKCFTELLNLFIKNNGDLTLCNNWITFHSYQYAKKG